jgi:hypothetical protein
MDVYVDVPRRRMEDHLPPRIATTPQQQHSTTKTHDDDDMRRRMNKSTALDIFFVVDGST